MNEVSSSISKMSTDFSEKVKAVEDNYRGNWNDSVHDSFNRYLNLLNDSNEQLKSKCINMINSDLGIYDEKISKIAFIMNSLCGETEEI